MARKVRQLEFHSNHSVLMPTFYIALTFRSGCVVANSKENVTQTFAQLRWTCPFCNRTWDGWLCWGDTVPGTVMQMCPEYFRDFDPGEKVTKVCNPDGQWFHHPESNRVWTNYTQCQSYTKDKLKFAFSLYYLAMVGHGVSIVSLIICLIIFSYFKSLSCQRISLHKNMFLSFILNSIVTIMWLSLNMAKNQAITSSNPISCKVLAVLTQYTFTSTFFWMLCEGIYLHTLIIVAVFVGEQQLFWYYVLGWGFPVVPAVTYAVARGLLYNDKCWISSHTQLVYIIHGPIQAALLVNLFFLLNIVRVLITKLKETHCAESTTYLKAVRATLILIPLLGVQFILFPWRPEGHISRAIYELFFSIFSHFQVTSATISCQQNEKVLTWAYIEKKSICPWVHTQNKIYLFNLIYIHLNLYFKAYIHFKTFRTLLILLHSRSFSNLSTVLGSQQEKATLGG
uniref:Calcitonin gene-related peptide type 1 receptor n=1 Tax=Neogobius melanostomus TaxID=47308 RepID=A0A8C6WUX8_9GOBI